MTLKYFTLYALIFLFGVANASNVNIFKIKVKDRVKVIASLDECENLMVNDILRVIEAEESYVTMKRETDSEEFTIMNDEFQKIAKISQEQETDANMEVTVNKIETESTLEIGPENFTKRKRVPDTVSILYNQIKVTHSFERFGVMFNEGDVLTVQIMGKTLVEVKPEVSFMEPVWIEYEDLANFTLVEVKHDKQFDSNMDMEKIETEEKQEVDANMDVAKLETDVKQAQNDQDISKIEMDEEKEFETEQFYSDNYLYHKHEHVEDSAMDMDFGNLNPDKMTFDLPAHALEAGEEYKWGVSLDWKTKEGPTVVQVYPGKVWHKLGIKPRWIINKWKDEFITADTWERARNDLKLGYPGKIEFEKKYVRVPADYPKKDANNLNIKFDNLEYLHEHEIVNHNSLNMADNNPNRLMKLIQQFNGIWESFGGEKQEEYKIYDSEIAFEDGNAARAEFNFSFAVPQIEYTKNGITYKGQLHFNESPYIEWSNGFYGYLSYWRLLENI